MAELPAIKFTELADALLARSDSLVPSWLPGGILRGHEYVCGSLSGGKGTSCSVNLVNGKWADFASDEKGNDLVGLYAAIYDLTMGKAAVQVAREEGLEDVAGVTHARDGAAPAPRPERAAPTPQPAKPHNDESWATVVPVPENAPTATFKHQYRAAADIEHTATYRGDMGELMGYVVRFRTSDGGKETLPYTWCTSTRDGASRWSWRQWDEPRPLYFPSGKGPTGWAAPDGQLPCVVLVEGEKKADILQALLTAAMPGVYLVTSWAGGCKAWKKAHWKLLQLCHVLLWPDCDGKREPLTRAEKAQFDNDADRDIAAAMKPLLPAHKQPGMAAMLGIGALLRDTHGCTVQMLPIPEPLTVPDGWDCADAINTDGWDFARVLAFFGAAQPLLAEATEPTPPPAAGDGGGSKKIDGPVDTDGDESRHGKPLPWWLKPYFDAEKGRWLTSRKLVIAALTHDEALSQILCVNELTNNIEALTPWPWKFGKAGPVTGAVDLALGKYLSDTYGLPSINRAALNEAIETVAQDRHFHPVREYLDGLTHDGTARIDKWLVYAIGETPQSLSPAMYEYLCLVGRYWLLGMVNRVMDPGCKFDYCPVLEGPGGLGKSTMVEALASAPWYSDAHFDLSRGKEGQEQVQGQWLYELAELAGFGKAEIQLIKAFISSKIDRYRPSYGRTVEAYPRQCVLVGTTNENTYLRDRTGNRRFWPIPVRARLNIPWLHKWRAQLLAEAYVLYQQGVAYTPGPDVEARLFVPMQESRLVETAVLSEMTHVLTRDPVATGIGATVNGLSEFVTISQLALALGVDAAKSNPTLEGQIRGWLDHEGWQRVKKQINGARAWGYTRPANWPPIEPPSGLDSGLDGSGHSGRNDEHKGADDEPF